MFLEGDNWGSRRHYCRPSLVASHVFSSSSTLLVLKSIRLYERHPTIHSPAIFIETSIFIRRLARKQHLQLTVIAAIRQDPQDGADLSLPFWAVLTPTRTLHRTCGPAHHCGSISAARLALPGGTALPHLFLVGFGPPSKFPGDQQPRTRLSVPSVVTPHVVDCARLWSVSLAVVA